MFVFCIKEMTRALKGTSVLIPDQVMLPSDDSLSERKFAKHMFGFFRRFRKSGGKGLLSNVVCTCLPAWNNPASVGRIFLMSCWFFFTEI
jgi:hypothetical protein